MSANFFYDVYVNYFVRHDVEGAEFCFGSGRHDIFDDLCNIEYGSVVRWVYGITCHEEVSSGKAACVWLAEVAGIAVDSQHHVTGRVRDDGLFSRVDVI